MVSGTQQYAVSMPLSRQTQHLGRRSGSPAHDSPKVWQHWFRPMVNLFATLQPPPRRVCVTSSKPSSVGVNTLWISFSNLPNYAFPPSSTSAEDTLEDPVGSGHDDPHDSQVAVQLWFPYHLAPVHISPPEAKISRSAIQKNQTGTSTFVGFHMFSAFAHGLCVGLAACTRRVSSNASLNQRFPSTWYPVHLCS